MSAIPAGFKQTEVGVIPQDWEVKLLPDVCRFRGGKAHEQHISDTGKYVCVNSKFISTDGKIRKYSSANFCGAKRNDVLMVMSDLPNGRALAKAYLVEQDDLYAVNQRVCALTAYRDCPQYLFYILNRNPYFLGFDDGVSQTHLLNHVFQKCQLSMPPSMGEQRAIAAALSDVDTLLAKLDQFIAKKRDLTQAAMQQLLTGQIRLPGFSGEWEVKRLEEIADCLDNLRVPLNEAQRGEMRGDYPYCGANGVLDFVNDYVLDDDIILIAEDGGYFDEYAYRPIAYRMIGKCWVNNHAHILKAKVGHDQGFLFFSLVHKNVLSYLASGTRAKLNKSEMWKIEVNMPFEPTEQTAIATVLSDMDAELAALEARRDKTRALKQGMMQELLTGRIRLV
ncbi:MAG TPA: restriction endonuclease subunit S [Accumulibacter sp.]|uniref:restriction endonuclease subunit S n=1 Tax=Accumulibacter sp. TaxID=2053492 RepID=UPI0025F8B368|nr:restriction endonuclease subunit S [Accumulibacter sp.]MCM8599612.1 restriction endonuclease subunit S [Accumulibacter sp.]MCM8663271.1 restriction endonuclease subunit S [Accumulibacter sp.]HNC50755.1 restriction endonuclease subunit S [Accumulibacter sp.]